jgi:trans-aconitate 2-methyltransferase
MIGEEPLFSDASSFAHKQQERAVSELLCGIGSDPPRRIAYLQTERPNLRELLERRFPGADISPLSLPHLDGPTPSVTRNAVDLIYCSGDLELLPLLPGLLPKLGERLKFGGRLAAHFPDNLYEPNRVLARMVAADGPWAKQLLPIA